MSAVFVKEYNQCFVEQEKNEGEFAYQSQLLQMLADILAT